MTTENSYSRILSRECFDKTPKTVFAALAVSFLLNHQNVPEKSIEFELVREWALLNRGGIVPQKPWNSKKKSQENRTKAKA